MTKGIKKKTHTAAFKLKVALAMHKGDKTSAEICSEYSISSSQAFAWKKELLENGSDIFDNKRGALKEDHDIDRLHATIGRLKVENDFLSKVLGVKST